MASQFWKDGCGERLNMFINMEEFCDVGIKFGDESTFFNLNCHYVVLALHSDVFKTSLDQKASTDGKRYLNFTNLSETEQSIVADIILSFYNGVLTIDELNFAMVYKFATDYQVHWILKQSRLEVHRFVHEGNLLNLMLVAERNKCKLLQNELVKYITFTRLSNYDKVMTKAQLLDLSPELFRTFLKANKHLDSRQELTILEYITSWMGKSPVKLAFCEKLMRNICWERLATSEVEVERLLERFQEELIPQLNEGSKKFVKDSLQDAANYAACRSTMERAQAVFITSRWHTFPEDLAEFVLSNDFLSVENEYVVAEAGLCWLDAQDQAKLTRQTIKSVLSSIRIDRLHSTYILTSLQPHVMQYDISSSEWHEICALRHKSRRSADETTSGSIVKVSPPPKKIAKDFFGLKNGTYTLTAACKCSYLCSTGPRECLSITVTVDNRAAPPVALKRSQCQYCNRLVIHFYCRFDNTSESFPSLNCGSTTKMRQMLKSSNVRLCAVLSGAEDRSSLVRSNTWYKNTVNTVLRTLSNDNLKSLTEYEILEGALDWLDHRLPDKTYTEIVLNCVRFNRLHETYLNEVIRKHLKDQYIVKPEFFKSLLKMNLGGRRTVPSTPCYKKILQCHVPRGVLDLLEGEHPLTTECLCEVTSKNGDIRIGTLTVTLTIAVKQIPALTVTARCNKCNISLRHSYLTTPANLPYYPGLATATVYRLREIFTASLQADGDSDIESGNTTPSSIGSGAGTLIHKRNSTSLTRGLSLTKFVSRDIICLNLILGP